MLFDPRPKCSREELFDREEELKKLHRAVEEGQPLILLTGIRRIGKTSVLCVFLNEAGLPYILLDGRSLPPNYGVRDLYEQLAHSMSNPRFLERMRGLLERVRGVRIVGFEVELAWRGRDAVSLTALFDSLNRERLIVAVDEAQKLRGPRGRIFLEALAHAYDYNHNITFILTGSEVGLLYDYLGLDDPHSPMYGRYLVQLSLRRFTRDEALEFLERGFREAGFLPPRSYLEEIVEAVDGIPGWLTLAGNYVATRRKLVGMEEVKRQAVSMAVRELEELGRTHGPRILRVLRLLAEGYNTWTSLKRRLEEVEGRTVSKSSLSRILHTLEKLSIIENYKFLDPIYKEAAKQLGIS
jgi:AAA+ ATPase superfamily predicted ATPase